MFLRPGGELRAGEDQTAGLKRLLTEVGTALSVIEIEMKTETEYYIRMIKKLRMH